MQVPLRDLEGRRTDAVEHAGDGAADGCGPRGDLEARWERFVFGRKRPFSFVPGQVAISCEKAASERALPNFPRTKLGSRTQQTVRALQNLYCSGQPMPWGYLCYHYIV